MFRPDSNRDRTDYGLYFDASGRIDILDRAVGTTYSLDLEHSQLWRYALDYLKSTIQAYAKSNWYAECIGRRYQIKSCCFVKKVLKVPTKPTALSILLRENGSRGRTAKR